MQSNEDLEIVDIMYEKTNSNQLSFRYLLSSACKQSVNTMETELKKLLAIQQLEKKYRFRAATETVTELRAHPSHIRYTLLAILFSHQHGNLIDSLADLLDEITLKIKNRAKNTTRKEAIVELELVKGKNKHIINLLKATVEHPEGIIQDTLFPIVSANIIQDIIKEMTKNDREYKEKM